MSKESRSRHSLRSCGMTLRASLLRDDRASMRPTLSVPGSANRYRSSLSPAHHPEHLARDPLLQSPDRARPPSRTACSESTTCCSESIDVARAAPAARAGAAGRCVPNSPPCTANTQRDRRATHAERTTPLDATRAPAPADQMPYSAPPGKLGGAAELLLDAQQLVVLRDAIGAATPSRS